MTESPAFRDAIAAAIAGAEQLQGAAVMLDDPADGMVAFATAELVSRAAQGASPDIVLGTAEAVQQAIGDAVPADRFQQVEAAAANASLPDLLAALAGLVASIGEALPGPVGDAAHGTARALADASAALG